MLFVLISTVIRPVSVHKRDAVFILCTYFNDVMEPAGTAFAVTSTKIVTAYHNIYDEASTALSRRCFLYRELSKGFNGMIDFSSERIDVEIVAGDSGNDWAVLKRVDNSEFSLFIPMCSEGELPAVSLDSEIVVYYAALGILTSKSGLQRIKIWDEKVSVMQYDGIGDSQVILSGGKCKGCSGAPIVDQRGRAVAFHTSSLNEYDVPEAKPQAVQRKKSKTVHLTKAAFSAAMTDVSEDISIASSQRWHADYSCGSVLCRLNGLADALLN